MAACDPISFTGDDDESIDLTIPQRAGYSIDLIYKDVHGVPVDVSTYTARMQIRENFGTSPIITLTSGSGIVLGASDGRVTVVFTGAQTGGFNFTRALWDLFMTPSGAEPIRLLKGTITLDKSVTV